MSHSRFALVSLCFFILISSATFAQDVETDQYGNKIRRADPAALAEAEAREVKLADEIAKSQAAAFAAIELEQKMLAQRQAFIASPHSARILKLIIDNPELVKHMEFLDSQKVKVTEVVEQLNENEVTLGMTVQERHQATIKRQELVKELATRVLMNTQLDELGENSIDRAPILAVLTGDTIVAEHLGISDKQRRSLLKKSSELALEFKTSVLNHKEKWFQLIFDNLTQVQKKKLVDLYGSKRLDETVSYMTPLRFFRSIAIGLPKTEQGIIGGLRFWEKKED